MSFNTFCNICFIKERIIKLCAEENESIFHILISFTSSLDIINDIIYLCVNCYNKLEEYNKIRELFLTNFVRFRYLYYEHKKQLEIRNAPDIETQLKAFVDANVERPSGSPLIQNCEVAQALKNNMESNLDICKESGGEFNKRNSHELLNKNDLSHSHTSFNPESNISGNDTNICYVKCENDCFNEDREKIHGNSVYIKEEPNRDRFEESQDPLVSDTVVNVTSRHDSADDDISDVSFNPEDSETGPTDNENKTSDTVCKVCDESFSCKSDLEEHICARTGKKHYICDKCKKIFTDVGRFRSHNRFHSDEKPYKCDECGLGFTQQSDLKRHKFRHTGKKPYSCDECQKTFTENFELIIHKRTHSGVKPYKCDECGLGFAQQANLNAHKRIHTGEKPYKCDECGMGFRHGSILKRHKLTHTGERPYSCDVCHKTFRESGTLITHKRIHSGEKPYKCDECGMEFAQASSIRRHKFTHTSERPYSCDECDKTFKHNYKLTKHKQTHSRERPYKCDECSSKFNSASDLKRHKRTHTG